MKPSNFSIQMLQRQYRALEDSNSIDSVSIGLVKDDLFQWIVGFAGPSDSIYEGGYFQVQFNFPNDYPNNPPEVKFLTEMWHPNIYKDGKVCVSILHSQNQQDFNDQEPPETRWRPILTAEDVLISIISLLVEPNINSPANVDASIQFRDKRQEYDKKVRQLIEKAFQNM